MNYRGKRVINEWVRESPTVWRKLLKVGDDYRPLPWTITRKRNMWIVEEHGWQNWNRGQHTELRAALRLGEAAFEQRMNELN